MFGRNEIVNHGIWPDVFCESFLLFEKK